MKNAISPQELAAYLKGRDVVSVSYGKSGEGCNPFPFVFVGLEFTGLSMFNGLQGWEIHASNGRCYLTITRITEAAINALDGFRDVVTVISNDEKERATNKLEIRYKSAPRDGNTKKEGTEAPEG